MGMRACCVTKDLTCLPGCAGLFCVLFCFFVPLLFCPVNSVGSLKADAYRSTVDTRVCMFLLYKWAGSILFIQVLCFIWFFSLYSFFKNQRIFFLLNIICAGALALTVNYVVRVHRSLYTVCLCVCVRARTGCLISCCCRSTAGQLARSREQAPPPPPPRADFSLLWLCVHAAYFLTRTTKNIK